MKSDCDNIWRIFGPGSRFFKMDYALRNGTAPWRKDFNRIDVMNEKPLVHEPLMLAQGLSIGRRVDLFCIWLCKIPNQTKS
jgi:hypothetical protein